MRRIVVIILTGILTASCSALKVSKAEKTVVEPDISDKGIIVQVKAQNLSENGFFVQKADIEIIGNEGNDKFLGSVKFEFPDRYLISLRGKSGIEAARILITGDTILVNDRINRTLYFGSSAYLQTKYGLTLALLPLLFGDIVDRNTKDDCRCIEGKAILNTSFDGKAIRYIIDCNRKKIIEVSVLNSYGAKLLIIRYTSFKHISNRNLPDYVTISDIENDVQIIIRKQKIIAPWDGKIEFIPGSNYELKMLK